ncbi:MAG: AAA family ATPase [candidate division SR1 bacterium]|nr:AAA family ATPase [candidate division SR1 bacterium]
MFKDNPIAEQAINSMLKTKKNMYITGDAGTGKTTLLNYFLEKTDKHVVVLAPTGMAAVQINGETIHSFCRFSTDPGWVMMEEGKIHKLRDNRKIKSIDTLLIDEISMVRSDMLDALDYFFRINKGKMRLPFGGVQVIFFGDHFQLPPVLRSEEKTIFYSKYDTEYFFGARVYQQLNISYTKLTKYYRQTDETFIRLLSYLRYGKANEEIIDWVNRKLLNKDKSALKNTIIIASRNQDVTNTNYKYLDELEGEVVSYRAILFGTFKDEMCPAEKFLVLKVGAQVMFVKNDIDKRWVNGTIGQVVELDKESIKVRIKQKVVEVELASWQNHTYRYDEEKGELVKELTGEYTQYPLRLAWAVTIHKSQGQTFDECEIDLGSGAFVYGQTYVAFSRCKSIEGLLLSKPLRLRDIKTDPKVFAFDQSVGWNN